MTEDELEAWVIAAMVWVIIWLVVGAVVTR